MVCCTIPSAVYGNVKKVKQRVMSVRKNKENIQREHEFLRAEILLPLTASPTTHFGRFLRLRHAQQQKGETKAKQTTGTESNRHVCQNAIQRGDKTFSSSVVVLPREKKGQTSKKIRTKVGLVCATDNFVRLRIGFWRERESKKHAHGDLVIVPVLSVWSLVSVQ